MPRRQYWAVAVGVNYAARLAINALLGGLASVSPDLPAWQRAVYLLTLEWAPEFTAHWFRFLMFAVLPAFLGFLALFLVSRNLKLRSAWPYPLAVLLIDQALQLAAPMVGTGVRWTAPLAEQASAILDDATALAWLDAYTLGLAAVLAWGVVRLTRGRAARASGTGAQQE